MDIIESENSKKKSSNLTIINIKKNIIENSPQKKHKNQKTMSKTEKILKIYIQNLITHNKTKFQNLLNYFVNDYDNNNHNHHDNNKNNHDNNNHNNHNNYHYNNNEIPLTCDFFLSSFNLIEIYGPDIYKFSLKLENSNSLFIPNFLARHNNIPNVYRTRIINWMFEIFSNYNSEPLSFYTSVSIFDKFLLKSQRTINDYEIQLIAMCCIFISSKLEDIIPLHMIHIKKNIGHNLYKEIEISHTEIEILNTLNFDVFCVTSYHFIKNFLYDFVINNRNLINKFNLNKFVDSLEKICLYVNKIVLINTKFLKYKCSLIAISVIVISFDILRSNSKTLKKENENFLKQWIIFLIKESEYSNKLINHVYAKIVEYLNNADEILENNAPKIKEEGSRIEYY
jgi:hypothetical protein